MVIGIAGAVVFLTLRTMTVIMKEKLQDYQCEKQHPTKDCSISLDSELVALKKNAMALLSCHLAPTEVI